MKANKMYRKRVKFTDVSNLMERLQKLSQKLDSHAQEIQLLNYLIVSLRVQNKTMLRNFLGSAEKDPIKIEEYQVREQILSNAKNIVEKLIVRLS